MRDKLSKVPWSSPQVKSSEKDSWVRSHFNQLGECLRKTRDQSPLCVYRGRDVRAYSNNGHWIDKLAGAGSGDRISRHRYTECVMAV